MAVCGKAFDRSPPSEILRLPREGGKRFSSRATGGGKSNDAISTRSGALAALGLGTFLPPPFLTNSLEEIAFIVDLFSTAASARESVSGQNADRPRQLRLRVRRSGRGTFSKERGQRETSGRSSSARNDAVTVVEATGLEFLVDLFRRGPGRWR